MEGQMERKEAARALGKLLVEHKGANVMVLDVAGTNSWADYFVIATVSSATHSKGLLRHVREALKSLNLEIRPTRRKLPDGDDWILIDLGDIIVHLMTEHARSFYDLEKLWYGAANIL